MDLTQLMQALWEQYTQITPSAKKIHQLLGQGRDIVNDHIALRTMNIPGFGVKDLGFFFEALGYKQGGEYQFQQKKLYARHYQSENEQHPKIFISELLLEQCSDFVQSTMQALVQDIPRPLHQDPKLLFSGTHWHVCKQTYEQLLDESEYAAWFAAFGYRANHFTVSVNHLDMFTQLEDVNTYLKSQGFELNTAGGEIKGSADVFLEQSSTLADVTSVVFSDGALDIPGCFYEFAKRYPQPDGQLYQGFVAASADKIFQSTDAKK